MARTLTPNDCHTIMNLLVKEATGQDATIQAVDSSSFVSCGETVLATGTENTLNALSIVLGKTFMAVRPYEAKLKIISALDSGLYNQRMRKISFYAREAQAAGDWNTDINKENLKNGIDNGAHGTTPNSSVGTMWEQNAPVPLELNFAGQSVFDESTTIYENQLKVAFSNESEFGAFVGGIMTEKGNDIESAKEAFNRMTLLNHIAGVYDMSAAMPGSVVNLTKEFNDTYGTNYTSAQLRTTHLKEFLEFFVARFKLTSDYMTNRSINYHWVPTKAGYTLMRHTPKSKQKAVLYSPLFTQAEATVMPEIFNPSYLSLDNYEGVTYWQNINEPAKISVTPAIPNVAAPAEQKVGDAVELDYVVGMIFDTDAIMTDYQFEDSLATPVEARKRYRNIFWHFSKNAINDFTENAVIFIMKDEDDDDQG